MFTNIIVVVRVSRPLLRNSPEVASLPVAHMWLFFGREGVWLYHRYRFLHCGCVCIVMDDIDLELHSDRIHHTDGTKA